MTILSLRYTLLYCLNRALSDKGELEASSFINFLHVNKIEANAASSASRASAARQRLYWQQIPLQKKQRTASVFYTSALPQILVRNPEFSQHSTLSEVSQQTVSRLNQSRFNHLKGDADHRDHDLALLLQLWSEFEIETQRPGWVAFRLSEIGLSLWLQQFQLNWQDSQLSLGSISPKSADQPSKSSNSLDNVDLDHNKMSGRQRNTLPEQSASKKSSKHVQPPGNSLSGLSAGKALFPNSIGAALYKASSEARAMLWAAQYTHARCCTLLHLWQELQPGRIPSLTAPLAGSSDSLWLTAENLLRVHTPQARQLIQTLIEITDDLFEISYQWTDRQYFLLLKLAAQLCQSFEQFYSACLSGFGRVPATSDRSEALLFRARFGLVLATQYMLKSLLQGCFAAETPDSL